MLFRSIWFASRAKYDARESKIDVMKKTFFPPFYMESPVGATAILRENNMLYDVIGTKNIATEKAKVMIISHVESILEEEMDLIEQYVKNGGSLYVSGPIGHERLEHLLGVKVTGRTEHDFTYMSPTEAGKELFEGFTSNTPLTIPMYQTEGELLAQDGDGSVTVLATKTLPYTMTNTYEFAAIHSNPPGIYTDKPAVVLRQIGESKLIWAAAPIEMSRPYLSKQVFKRIVEFLRKDVTLESNAPKFVEIVSWEKEGKQYLSVINQQEESPIAPMYDIWITVKAGQKARLLPAGEELEVEKLEDGRLKLMVPKLEIFHMIEVE